MKFTFHPLDPAVVYAKIRYPKFHSSWPQLWTEPLHWAPFSNSQEDMAQNYSEWEYQRSETMLSPKSPLTNHQTLWQSLTLLSTARHRMPNIGGAWLQLCGQTEPGKRGEPGEPSEMGSLFVPEKKYKENWENKGKLPQFHWLRLIKIMILPLFDGSGIRPHFLTCLEKWCQRTPDKTKKNREIYHQIWPLMSFFKCFGLLWYINKRSGNI